MIYNIINFNITGYYLSNAFHFFICASGLQLLASFFYKGLSFPEHRRIIKTHIKD